MNVYLNLSIYNHIYIYIERCSDVKTLMLDGNPPVAQPHRSATLNLFLQLPTAFKGASWMVSQVATTQPHCGDVSATLHDSLELFC